MCISIHGTWHNRMCVVRLCVIQERELFARALFARIVEAIFFRRLEQIANRCLLHFINYAPATARNVRARSAIKSNECPNEVNARGGDRRPPNQLTCAVVLSYSIAKARKPPTIAHIHDDDVKFILSRGTRQCFMHTRAVLLFVRIVCVMLNDTYSTYIRIDLLRAARASVSS